MSRSQRARWRHAVIWVLVGLVALTVLVSIGSHMRAAVATVLCLAAAWLSSPLRSDRSVTHWDAQARHVRDGSVVVYWRPGSLGCLRLRSSLRSVSDKVLWVDIWADDEAAAFVRDLNGGAEVVPTAILRNGDAVSHPTPEALRVDLSRVRTA